ncbi:MAG: PLP-dependent aminotransferase family protein, partial [Myxococcota bacterium]|nr:PLP-dependent aminotransferase family protein [Myxococcota bacterium]
YAEARRRGLVHGEVGRGTFVAAPTSAPLRPRDPTDPDGPVDLGVNVPLREPAADLAAALRALAARPDLEARAGYGAPAGDPDVRAAGATWLAELGVRVPAERVVVCNGAQHAVDVALGALAGPGELVLAEALTWPGFVAAARRRGLRVKPVPVDAEGLDPEAVAAICAEERPRLLYAQPTLHNPTTARLSPARRERLAAVARAHDLLVLVDEVQGGMLEDDAPALGALAPDHVLTVAGVSKILSPALRIAFLAAPAGLVERVVEGVWSTVWMASPLGAALAAAWIEDGTARRVAAARREAMDARHARARVHLGDALRLRPGSYHGWLDLRRADGDDAAPAPDAAARMAERLRARGVVVTPADAFLAAPGAAPPALRLALSAPPAAASREHGRAAVAAARAAARAERPRAPRL